MTVKTTVSEQWNGQEVKIRGQRVVGKTAYEVGLVVEGQAKLLAPYDTGRLRGSITTASKEKQSAPEAPASTSDAISPPADDQEVLVGTAVDYGPYQEFGTVRTAAHPFLRPALDLARGNVLSIIENNGRKEFKEYLQ